MTNHDLPKQIDATRFAQRATTTSTPTVLTERRCATPSAAPAASFRSWALKTRSAMPTRARWNSAATCSALSTRVLPAKPASTTLKTRCAPILDVPTSSAAFNGEKCSQTALTHAHTLNVSTNSGLGMLRTVWVDLQVDGWAILFGLRPVAELRSPTAFGYCFGRKRIGLQCHSLWLYVPIWWNYGIYRDYMCSGDVTLPTYIPTRDRYHDDPTGTAYYTDLIEQRRIFVCYGRLPMDTTNKLQQFHSNFQCEAPCTACWCGDEYTAWAG